jgi:hypothetical protein
VAGQKSKLEVSYSDARWLVALLEARVALTSVDLERVRRMFRSADSDSGIPRWSIKEGEALEMVRKGRLMASDSTSIYESAKTGKDESRSLNPGSGRRSKARGSGGAETEVSGWGPRSQVDLPVPLSPVAVPPSPLTQQYYRFLPLKFAMRVVAQAAGDDWPALWQAVADVEWSAGPAAARARSLNAQVGSFKLSTGFPSADERLGVDFLIDPASLARFRRFYIGRAARAGRVEGLGQELGLVAIEKRWNKKPIVGLTEAGVEFASLPNPFLDEGRPVPLSAEEARFLVQHIKRFRPAELEQMVVALRAIARSGDEGLRGADLWTQALKDYYASIEVGRRGATKARAAANAVTQSALLGRLNDLGLIEASGEARATTYRVNRVRVTEVGLKQELHHLLRT